MACSWDGSVAYIEFDNKELGHVISVDEKENIFHRMYGKKTFTTGIEKKSSIVIEDPDWIQAQKLDIPCPPTSAIIIDDDGGMLSSDSRASRSSQIVAKGPTDKQIETRTVDGKRRITPVFIPPPMEEDDTPSQASNHSTATAPLFPPTFSSSTESKSKIVVEKRDEVTRAGLPSSPPPPPPPPTATARKEISTLLLNRRLERSEPERRVATVKTASQSTVSTGISIARTAESEKTAITPLTAQKTLTILVNLNLLFLIFVFTKSTYYILNVNFEL